MPGWLSWASLRASWRNRSASACGTLGAAAEDLDGHGPVELRVVAEVHRAEAAGPQGVPHLVAAEGGGRGRGVPLRLPARPADPASGPRSDPTRSPAPAGLTAGPGSEESDCTATSPEGSR